MLRLLLAVLLSMVFVGDALANTFACCLPDGVCQEFLLSQCEDAGGVSIVGEGCGSDPCHGVGAPTMSGVPLLGLVTALLTLAIYSLMRRRGAAVSD